jgi:hypothetical protein
MKRWFNFDVVEPTEIELLNNEIAERNWISVGHDSLPWETQKLTPFCFARTFYALIAEPWNAYRAIKRHNIFRPYLFSIVIFVLFSAIEWGTNLVVGVGPTIHFFETVSQMDIISSAKKLVSALILPIGWALRDSIILFFIYYIVAKIKLSFKISLKVCLYASTYAFITWIPYLREIFPSIVGLMVGGAIGITNRVGLGKSLLASIIFAIVSQLLYHLRLILL